MENKANMSTLKPSTEFDPIALCEIKIEPPEETEVDTASWSSGAKSTDIFPPQVQQQQFDIALSAPSSSHSWTAPVEFVAVNEMVGGIHQQEHMKNNGKYKCSKCTQTFESKRKRDFHIKWGHTRAHYCDACNYKSTVRKHIESHMLYSHPEMYKFECKICGACVSSYHSLKLHVHIVHSKERTCKCTLCPKSFKYKGDLVRHERHVHKKEPKFLFCNKCKIKFPSSIKLQLHNIKSHREDNININCEYCGIIFHSKTVLLKHYENVHKEIKNINCNYYECPLCLVLFPTESELLFHKNSKCNSLVVETNIIDKNIIFQNQNLYCCTFCFKKFPSLNSLKHHENGAHAPIVFNCSCCNKKFNYKETLHAHIHSVHKNDTLFPFKCKKCPSSFLMQTALVIHSTSVHNYHIFNCIVCKDNFNSKLELYEHLKLSCDKVSMCKFCLQYFQTEYDLNNHMPIHDSTSTAVITTENINDNISIFQCKICNVVFNQEMKLIMHKESVHKELTCRICKIEFKQDITLSKHMAAVHNELKCSKCVTTFQFVSELMIHLDVMHK